MINPNDIEKIVSSLLFVVINITIFFVFISLLLKFPVLFLLLVVLAYYIYNKKNNTK